MEKSSLKAFGRSLSDFNNLTLAEQKLLDACRKGGMAVIPDTRPEQPNEANIVRADFVHFLALGGDEQAPVHEIGVCLKGAWVRGELNFIGTTLPHSLMLENCHLGSIFLLNSNVHGNLNFKGCHIESLQADRMVCKGSIFLKNGFTSTGKVALTGAQIDGDLECQGGRFNANGDYALMCERAIIRGGVFLKDDFTATGTVSLSGVEIGGNLDCNGGKFNGNGKDALISQSAVIKGNVFLRNGFTAIGTVQLSGAQISGNLECIRATLEGTKTNDKIGFALFAQNMMVSGMFFFCELMSVEGTVSLYAAKVGCLVDDDKSLLDEKLILNGFIYDRLASHSILAKSRLKWLLDRQSTSHAGLDGIGEGFKPQPWQQLQKVLREMGHIEYARQVAIAFEDRLRKANLIGQTDCYKPIAWIYQQICCFFHWCFGWLIGYGYRPLRLFIIMVFAWLACGGFYWYAALYGNQGDGVFAPSNALVFQEAKYTVCMPDSEVAKAEKIKPANAVPPPVQGAGNWYLCKDLPEEYTGFSPLVYSLDLILPLVDLQQEHDWSPMIPTPKSTVLAELSAFSLKRWTRFVMWLEILFGWTASLLLVAVVSGLTKRREE